MKYFIIFLNVILNFSFATQNIVVAELFTETWWPNCPDARAGIKQLYESQPYFIPLYYEGDGSNPSPNYNSRSSFYSVLGIPHVQFGGYLSSSGGGGDMYPTYYNRYNMNVFKSILKIYEIFHYYF